MKKLVLIMLFQVIGTTHAMEEGALSTGSHNKVKKSEIKKIIDELQSKVGNGQELINGTLTFLSEYGEEYKKMLSADFMDNELKDMSSLIDIGLLSITEENDDKKILTALKGTLPSVELNLSSEATEQQKLKKMSETVRTLGTSILKRCNEDEEVFYNPEKLEELELKTVAQAVFEYRQRKKGILKTVRGKEMSQGMVQFNDDIGVPFAVNSYLFPAHALFPMWGAESRKEKLARKVKKLVNENNEIKEQNNRIES